MTQLTDDDIRHIAKLARITIEEGDVSRFAKELSAILEYVNMLSEVDTSSVEPIAQVTGLQNSFREDTVEENGPSTEEMLATSPLPIIEQQIQTPSAH